MTAPAASCPLGPAHAGIKMRTHQHTIHCSPAPSSWSGERRQASFWSREKLQLQLLLQLQLQLLCTLQLPSRGSLQPDTGRCCSCLGGAGRGHQGEGRTVTISSALGWPPAYTLALAALATLPLAARGLLPPYFPGSLVTRDWGGQQIVTPWDHGSHPGPGHVSPSSARPRTDCLAWLLCGRLGLRTLDTARAQMSPAPSRTLM